MDGYETGEKIQDSYESRMSQIGQAKEAESKIIDLYKSGRRDKEDAIRTRTGRDDKVVKAMAKTSFNDSYRRTVDNIFEVSDLVDKTVDADNSLRGYKAGLGFDERTIGKRSIEDVKEKVQQKARDNIAEKIREQYQTGSNNNLDASTERRIQEETDARVSMFMRDLEREIDDKTDKHAELANDPTILKGDKLDYSETINSSHNLFISKDAHPLLPARRCVLPLPEISLKLSFSKLIRNIALYIWLKADITSFFKVASASACSSSNCLFCSSATMSLMCLKPNNNW